MEASVGGLGFVPYGDQWDEPFFDIFFCNDDDLDLEQTEVLGQLPSSSCSSHQVFDQYNNNGEEGGGGGQNYCYFGQPQEKLKEEQVCDFFMPDFSSTNESHFVTKSQVKRKSTKSESNKLVEDDDRSAKAKKPRVSEPDHLQKTKKKKKKAVGTKRKRQKQKDYDDEGEEGTEQISIACCSSLDDDDTASNKAKAGAAMDRQTLYARKRRERINERLKILQNVVPNGTKVDISTMLEDAVLYVKFLQLQIKLLSSEEMWMYAPLAYNGMDIGPRLGQILPPKC